jgi:WD40 repeat protein/tRNA A-37 threonylcarbamoyl transferase component Bud32
MAISLRLATSSLRMGRGAAVSSGMTDGSSPRDRARLSYQCTSRKHERTKTRKGKKVILYLSVFFVFSSFRAFVIRFIIGGVHVCRSFSRRSDMTNEPPVPPSLTGALLTAPAEGGATHTGQGPSIEHDLASRVTVPPQPQAPAAGPPEVPGYEVLGELGRGGMGVVYKARHLKLNRIVALKMVLAGGHAGPDDLQRFQREAEAAARLQHPHIVQIHEIGQHQGLPYFTLEYTAGGSLKQKLAHQPQPPAEAARLTELLAQAVQHAHRQGVIHRDLKPANVLLTEDGAPKVTDFGLAKPLESSDELTHTGAILGTPSYMAPEQAAGKVKEVGPAADVYALGAVLYEMLTGRPPFQGPMVQDTLMQVLADEPVSPRRLQPQTPRDLETICLKCLEKSPAKRYVSAADLAADLGRFRAGEPIQARPVGGAERALKWMRRRPTLAAVYVLVPAVLLLGGGGGGALWLWQQAEGERERARTAETRANGLAEKLQAALDELDRVAYLDQVALAGTQWQAGNVAQARALLDGCQQKYRRWEWHYLNREFHPELAVATGHTGSVMCVVFSPDGTRLATASADGTARVWEAASCKQLALLKGHMSYVGNVSFSPDGTRLATASADGTARVWDAASGEQLALLKGHTSGVSSVIFRSDGTRLATASPDGTARVWDAVSGKQLALLPGHTKGVWSVNFSPDGTRLATASADGTAWVWDAASGKQLALLKGHTSYVGNVCFGPDGARVATASRDGTARVWDAASGAQLALLQGHTNEVLMVSFSPDDTRLATASLDGTARVWDAASGKQLALLQRHTSLVRSVSFSPDGARLATASYDGTARVWDAASGKQLALLQGHTSEIESMSFSPDGLHLATASRDGTARIWDTSGAQVVLQHGQAGWVWSVSFSPDGARLATASEDGARVWDAASGKQLALLQGHKGWLSSVSFSPDGTQLATASADGTARVWDAVSGKQLALLRGHTKEVLSVSFGPNARLATASRDRTARVWDAASGKQLALLQEHTNEVRSVSFSPDGARLATASVDGTARVWDAVSGKQLALLQGHKGGGASVSFSPDGARLATGSLDGTARVLDTASGKQLALMQGHKGGVLSVSFSPDGLHLATAGGDGTARIWDAASGKQLALLQTSTNFMLGVSFSPDGVRLATASADGAARLSIAHETEAQLQQRRRNGREQRAEDAEKTKNWFAAAFLLGQLIREQPHNDDLYRRRAIALLNQGKWFEALTVIDPGQDIKR